MESLLQLPNGMCNSVTVAYAQTPIITMPISQSVGQIQLECTWEEISGIE
jgi:hypothetical protein